ncbi:MAG: hypothetical protein P9L88_03265 [Candidatus Tantalella remota]|nr:hypothetical protein [Candidatus Tantalella remota]
MKRWLIIFGIVFVVEVFAEAAHLLSEYMFLSEVSRNSIVAFIALFLSVTVLVYRES